jgi:hypothetical protein
MTGVTAEIAARRERRHHPTPEECKERITYSVRLGPESFAPVVPDDETVEIARTAAALGEERP